MIRRLVISLPYWYLSGANTFAATLTSGLRARGWAVDVLATEPNAQSAVRESPPAELGVEALDYGRDRSWRGRLEALRRDLARRAPCIYLPTCDFNFMGVARALPRDVHVVGVVHSDDPIYYGAAARHARSWDALVAVSVTVHDRLLRIVPHARERIVHIPYGIEPPSRAPRRESGDRLRLVYAGRLEARQKRVMDLVRIQHELSRRSISHVLHVVGDGSERAAMAAALAHAVERGEVSFHGLLEHHEALAVLATADALLLTSEFEGLPLALLEAMAREVVPIASHVHSGVGEIVRDGVNGFLVPVGDIAAFADRIALLASSPERTNAMGAAARTSIAAGPYSLTSMLDAYEALFSRTVEAARGGRFIRRPASIYVPEHLPLLAPPWVPYPVHHAAYRVRIAVKRARERARSIARRLR